MKNCKILSLYYFNKKYIFFFFWILKSTINFSSLYFLESTKNVLEILEIKNLSKTNGI